MRKGNGARLLSERLFAALTIEVDALDGAPKGEGAEAGPGAKGRVEAISLLTRTLEKLLELRRLEALALRMDSDEDEAETERLRAEMLKRLRALDARRETGPRLFGPDGALLTQEADR